MELTPELLELLKQLLDVCAKEAERAKEAEQTQAQVQKIALQIRKILASM